MSSGVSEGPTLTVGRFVAGFDPAVVSEQVRERAKLTVLDTLGVTLAAHRYPIAARLLDHLTATEEPEGPARVLGTARHVSATTAAMLNGTLSNALDFDEGPHLATHVLPAVLALGEHRRASGAAVLDAYLVGREVGSRVTRALDSHREEGRGPTSRGWWHVGVVGPLAAAAGCARLLGLDAVTSATAVVLATCRAGGQRANMGTMAKALHSGNAAAAGVEAARLAAAGFTADLRALEAPLGFGAALCRDDECDWSPVAAPWDQLELDGTGVRIKPYPACTPIFPILDAVVDLHARGVRAEDTVRLTADLHTFSLLRDEPVDAMEAGFSGRFLVATTLLNGRFDLDLLTDAAVADRRVRDVMELVEHAPGTEGVLVETADGVRHTAVAPRRRRLSDPDAVHAKFHRCADEVLGVTTAEHLAEQVSTLDELDDVRRLASTPGAVA